MGLATSPKPATLEARKCAKLDRTFVENSKEVIELLDELKAWTGVEVGGTAHSAAWNVPLLHRTMNPVAVAETLATGTGELEPGVGSNSRIVLGTGGCVFLWVGRCAFPGADMILVWEPSMEDTPVAEEAGLAAPWDSGGLLSSPFGFSLSESHAIAALDKYSLPLPMYRAYLAGVLEVCFSEQTDYLSGVSPSSWYPGWDAGTDHGNSGPPSHTFEVRYPGALPMNPGLVAVILDATTFAQEPRVLRKLRTYLKNAEIDFVVTRRGMTVEDAAQLFVSSFLNERGVLGW